MLSTASTLISLIEYVEKESENCSEEVKDHGFGRLEYDVKMPRYK